MKLKDLLKVFLLLLFAGLIFFLLNTVKTSGNVEVSKDNHSWILDYIAKHSAKGQDPQIETDYAKHITVHNQSEVSDGLVLIPFSGSDKIILIDNAGNLKNQWNLDVDRARIDKQGNILAVHGSKFRHKEEPWWTLRNTVAIYDQAGSPFWHYTAQHPAHHDAHFLDNGNILFLSRDYLAKDRVHELQNASRKKAGVEYDLILEVSPDQEIVWSWSAINHFDLNYCGARDCDFREQRFGKPIKEGSSKAKLEKAISKVADWTHTNTASVIPENKWFDSGDTRFKPGNIILMTKNFEMFFIIDKDSKKIVFREDGKFLGRLGNAHEPHMIAKEYPGAGNILVFQNDGLGKKRQSAIVEFNPITKEIVWTYENPKFFNATRGAVQRLKNGNTLISEDNTGRVFEVTQAGKTVWEFRAPEPISRAYRY